VENSGIKSRLINWRAFDDENFGIRWQMDSTNEQTFTLLPIIVKQTTTWKRMGVESAYSKILVVGKSLDKKGQND